MDFLSHAAIVGFMGGAAIVIGLQQLKGLLGISHFTTKTDVVSVLEAVFRSLHHQVRLSIGDNPQAPSLNPCFILYIIFYYFE